MLLDHNMLSQALNNQSALRKSLFAKHTTGGKHELCLFNWIAYLGKSISIIKFHVTDSYQFSSKKNFKTKPRITSTTLYLLQLFQPEVSDLHQLRYICTPCIQTVHVDGDLLFLAYWQLRRWQKWNSPNGMRKKPHPSTQLTRQRLVKAHLTPLLLFAIFQTISQVVPSNWNPFKHQRLT